MADKHQHTPHYEGSSNAIRTAFFLNLAFTVFEIIGGLYVNSIAIVSDAIHDLGDSLSLGTAWYLQKKSSKSATKNFSFGYRRFSLLGALINSLILIVGSVFIIIEVMGRFLKPEYPDTRGMFVLAIIGVLVNGYAAWKMSRGKSMNERVISWHFIEDVLGWVAVLVASVILYFYESPYIDPVLSLLITVYIVWNVFKRLKETLHLFLQGHPADINQVQLEQEILAIEQIQSLHHTHIWSLDGEHHVFTTHVKLNTIDSLEELLSVKNRLKKIMKKYPFEHYTIETEIDTEYCALDSKI